MLKQAHKGITLKKSSIIIAVSLAYTLGMTPSTTFSQSKASQYVKEFETIFPDHRFRVNKTVFGVEAARSELCVVGSSEANEILGTWLHLLSTVFEVKRQQLAYRQTIAHCPSGAKVFFRVLENEYHDELVAKDHKELSEIWRTPQFATSVRSKPKRKEGYVGSATIFGWSEKWHGSYARTVYYKKYANTSRAKIYDQLFKRVVLEEIYHSTLFAADKRVVRHSKYGIFSLIHEPMWAPLKEIVIRDDADELSAYLNITTSGLCEFDVFSMVAIDELFKKNVSSEQQSSFLHENFDKLYDRTVRIMQDSNFETILDGQCWNTRLRKVKY